MEPAQKARTIAHMRHLYSKDVEAANVSIGQALRMSQQGLMSGANFAFRSAAAQATVAEIERMTRAELQAIESNTWPPEWAPDTRRGAE